ncbi:MAG: hypothetical protein HGA44_13110, partial [Cellulomonadaceae bacterium]|nr:hypothetical protein [Cellulomonadaceae bacterium]
MVEVSLKWAEPARVLLEQDGQDWIGLWMLLDAAGHAAFALSLAAPLGAGVDLAFAAIELGEARDEVEWLHEHLAEQPPVRLGPLHVSDNLDDARRVVEQLVDAATARTLRLIDEA